MPRARTADRSPAPLPQTTLAVLVVSGLAALALLAPSRASALDHTTWPLSVHERARVTENDDGFTVEAAEPGAPFGFTVRATADSSGGSDSKIGPIRWMAPESLVSFSGSGGFSGQGTSGAPQQFLRLVGTESSGGFEVALETEGDLLGSTVTVMALENGNPLYEAETQVSTSPLYEGSAPPSGGGAVGTPLTQTYQVPGLDYDGDGDGDGYGSPDRPRAARGPGGAGAVFLYERGTLLRFPDGTEVRADEVRVGIWGTTGTLLEVDELAFSFTPSASSTAPIRVIDMAQGVNGHTIRLAASGLYEGGGGGGGGRVALDPLRLRPTLVLEPTEEGFADLSAQLAPGQVASTLFLSDEQGAALTPPAQMTHQGRVLGGSGPPLGAFALGRVVPESAGAHGLRMTLTGSELFLEPATTDVDPAFRVEWETTEGASGASGWAPSLPTSFAYLSFCWPKQWKVAMTPGAEEIVHTMRFDPALTLVTTDSEVPDVSMLRVRMALSSVPPDPILAAVDTEVSGWISATQPWVGYGAGDFAPFVPGGTGPGSTGGPGDGPAASATGRAFLQRASDGTVLVGGLHPPDPGLVDGVRFDFGDGAGAMGDVFGAEVALVPSGDGSTPTRVVMDAITSPAAETGLLLPAVQAFVEPEADGGMAISFDLSAVTSSPTYDVDVLDGAGNLIERHEGIVHRDIAARNVLLAPTGGWIEADGAEVAVCLVFGQDAAARPGVGGAGGSGAAGASALGRSLVADFQVRARVPAGDLRVRSLGFVLDGPAATFATPAVRSVATDVPPLSSGLLTLHAPFPNPCNPRTTIRFEVDRGGPVTLRVYDLRGRLVDDLVEGVLPAGSHTRIWDGTDFRGAPVASGAYLVRLSDAATSSLVRRVMLVR